MANKLESAVISPKPIYLLLGLGLPLLLSTEGIIKAIYRRGNDWTILLVIWLVAGFALVYSPLPYQRKLAQGLQLPAMVLAVSFLSTLLVRLGSRRWLLATGLLLLTVPSNVFFVVRAMRDLSTNNTAYLANLMPPLYLRPDQYHALTWLDAHTTYSDIVLCNSFLGSYVPSLAGCRTYAGHWDETIDFPEKLRAFKAFLSARNNNNLRTKIINDANITYLIRDNSIYDDISLLDVSGKVQTAFDTTHVDWLEQVWQEDNVAVYRIHHAN
jgi:hypothetical protein